MPNNPVNPEYVMNFSKAGDFMEGQVLLIDKPLEWTSFDVVNKLRYHLRKKLGVKKIKVGHAGTLDPLASGVLVVCTGRATKAIERLQSDSKSYEATIRLGATTPCLDAELPVSDWSDVNPLNSDQIHKAAAAWTGKINQLPPLYSAKKIKGQKAYAVARKGGDIELEPVTVEVTEFRVRSIRATTVESHDVLDVEATISCSKGTYIRALARDLATTLGVGGYLIELRRTRSGAFDIGQCRSLESLLQAIDDLPDDLPRPPVDL